LVAKKIPEQDLVFKNFINNNPHFAELDNWKR
jgi:hypothetical protein